MYACSEKAEDRLPKQVRKWYPVGIKERKGRPKTTWMGEIRGMMREMGLKEEGWRDTEKIADRK